VVVRGDEYKAYHTLNPDREYIILPQEIDGISATRQFILDYGIPGEERSDHFCMIDDDIRNFGIKPDINEQSIVMVKDDAVVDSIFKDLETLLELGYAHAGIYDRPRCGLSTGSYYSENGLAMQIIAFNRKTIHKEQLRFDDVLLAQDKHMTLSLLERGYKNALIAYATYNCLGTQAQGGCSLFRTAEMIDEQAILLHKLHPTNVSITPKLVNYDGIQKVVNKVRIGWKNAYRPRVGNPQPNL
jgi:hypothetical protein